jgi:class 3 adenylate cyclase/HAMP domain-containing protein
VIRPETSDISTINVRMSVRRDGRFLGIFAATVQTDQLSKLLDDGARSLNGTAFILYDEHFLLAHPLLVSGNTRRGSGVLPTIADVGDPVIEAFGNTPRGALGRVLAERAGIRLIDVSGKQYALVASRLDRYGDKPWEVGVYFPADDLLAEFSRLRWALAAGVAVLLAALVVAFGFSRYLTAPLNRLALAAQRISSLSLDQIERQPRGLFTEFNIAGQAFNSMVIGLRWFETYVPKKLVKRLVSSAEEEGAGSRFEFKERNVTVMFTDIARFTSLSEAMPAGDVAALLNHHFALVTYCIEAEGGTVDKFIGDCVMAFWGAPEKQKDHAARACRAALAIAAAAKQENMDARAAGKPVLGVRIGLHSGTVIVGNIGAPGRINYTIIGDTVNTANRLEQMGKTLAPEAEAVIVLSGATLKAAGPGFDAKSVGAVSVRGRQGQVDVYVKEI